MTSAAVYEVDQVASAKLMHDRPRIANVAFGTHRFKFDKILEAYETFGHAADTRALKVMIEVD